MCVWGLTGFLYQPVAILRETRRSAKKRSEMQLKLAVTPGFCNPIPSEWKEIDTSLVIEFGTAMVRVLKSQQSSQGNARTKLSGEFMDQLQCVLRNHDDSEAELHRLRTELALERQEVAAERERANAKVEAVRSAVRLEVLQTAFENEEAVRVDARRLASVENDRLESRVTSAELQLRAERVEFVRSMQGVREQAGAKDALHESERRNLGLLVSSLTRDVQDRDARLAKLSVASNKGNAVEGELRDKLSALGMHVYDTSKGKHNLHYHDMLVALSPLVPGTAVDGMPTYSPEQKGAVRCCVEWKGHTQPGGLSVELQKFAAVRRKMIAAGTSECFCFAAQTDIPGRRRHHFEVVSDAGRKSCVTSYVGSGDVTDIEVALTVHFTILLQLKLDEVEQPSQPEGSDELLVLVDVANSALCRMRQCVERCDEMDRLATSMNLQLQSLRSEIVECALSHVRPLAATGRLPDNTAAVDFSSALSSLQSDKRSSRCKILKSKAQFVSAQKAADAFSREHDVVKDTIYK